MPTTDAAVHAACDFLDNMRIRSVDVLARGSGAAAALRLLEQRGASIRRVVLIDAAGTVRSGPKLIVLAAAEATPARLVELLAP